MNRNELTPPSVIHVPLGGCIVKQAMYRYYRLISRRATFRYCQMYWLLVVTVHIHCHIWCTEPLRQCSSMVLSLNLIWFQVCKVFLQNCDNWPLRYLLSGCNSDVTVDPYILSYNIYCICMCVLVTIAVHGIYKFSDVVTFCFIDLLLLII